MTDNINVNSVACSTCRHSVPPWPRIRSLEHIIAENVRRPHRSRDPDFIPWCARMMELYAQLNATRAWLKYCDSTGLGHNPVGTEQQRDAGTGCNVCTHWVADKHAPRVCADHVLDVDKALLSLASGPGERGSRGTRDNDDE